MKKSTEEKGLEYLKEIEEEVSELKESAPTPKKAFLMGIMQGMGVVLGSIFAVTLLGWVLSLLGFIPGLTDVAVYLSELADKAR